MLYLGESTKAGAHRRIARAAHATHGAASPLCSPQHDALNIIIARFIARKIALIVVTRHYIAVS